MSDEQQTALRNERMQLLAAMVQDLRAKLARAEAERDALRAALAAIMQLPAGSDWKGTPNSRIEEAHDIASAALLPGLVRAITQALIADSRAPVEVYAELAQNEPWAALWHSLGIAERNSVVAQARKEAGR